MIDAEKIVFGKPIYYMPGYGGTIKVSILKLLDSKRVLVKQHSKDKDLQPFSTQIAHVYDSNSDAIKGNRAWETYMRRRKREKKQEKKQD